MSTTDHTSDLTSENWRMNAYYYGFDRTGQVAIDRILSAVAHAGKGYHHTEFWTDPLDYGAPSHLRGDSYVECIQNAAIDAADTLRTAEARAAAAEVASRGYRERAEKAEAKATRSAGLLGHQSRTLTDTIASEVLRQKAVAWDEGKAAGLRQSDWEHGDTARMYIARNPYYATPPTTTEETTHE